MPSFSSFPVDTVSLPNFCFDVSVHPGEATSCRNGDFGNTLLHDCHEFQALSTLGSLRKKSIQLH